MLEKTLESSLDCKEINQSILKEINPEYSLARLMLKLKLQYLMQRSDLLEKILMLGKIEGGEEGDDTGWDGCMASPTQWTWASSGRWWRTGKPGVLQYMGLQRVGMAEWLKNNNVYCLQVRGRKPLMLTSQSALKNFFFFIVEHGWLSMLC